MKPEQKRGAHECPFLKEEEVRYCNCSPFKKMIPRILEHTASERCCTPEWVNCPYARLEQVEDWNQTQCPFLHESLVQYCAASPATKFIPYSESSLSRCGTEAHRYCELYLALAHPENETTKTENSQSYHASFNDDNGCPCIDGILVPAANYYTLNHMWLDKDESGCCHIGIDAFLATVLGDVDNIDFLESKDTNRPAVVVTAHEMDLQLVFPIPLQTISQNTYLRSHPGKLVSDPYTAGWLFQTKTPCNDSDILMHGDEAFKWMQNEINQLSQFIHTRIVKSQHIGAPFIMDGGTFAGDLLRHLNRQEILDLFNDFFSPYRMRGSLNEASR